MTTIRLVRTAVVFAMVTAGMTVTAAAQTNDEATPFPSLQWNFSTPGARANAMGRSFVGLADDASAAVTNPAGLTNLTRPQVYVEYKNTQLKIDRLAAVASSAIPMKLRPIPFARAPGVEKLHCNPRNNSSLVCAPAVAAMPAVTIAKITSVRTDRIIVIQAPNGGESSSGATYVTYLSRIFEISSSALNPGIVCRSSRSSPATTATSNSIGPWKFGLLART